MPPADLPDVSARCLRALARAAARSSAPDFLAAGDHTLYGGFAWEWLRNRPPAAISIEPAIDLLGDGGRGLDAFCRAVEGRWAAGDPLSGRLDSLLWACAALRCALPEDFWLPIEADVPLVVLSPTYREMRIRAYNRAVTVLPAGDRDPPTPRWQPYLNSVAIAHEQRLPGAPGVLAAAWAIHELSHVILMTAPPEDEGAPIPRKYVRWLLGQEGKTIAVESRISEEIRVRMPHPYFVGLFNTPSFADGFEPVTSVRELSRPLLRAWIDLCRYASPPRVPGRRALRRLQTNEEFAVGSLIYALTNRALFTSGERAALVRRLLPAPLADRNAARGLEKEVRALLTERSTLDARARARARRANEAVVRCFRAAELHDFVSVLPGGSAEDASTLHALSGRLKRARPSPAGLARADGILRTILRRRLPILAPFGFDDRYADTHPSLFDVRA